MNAELSTPPQQDLAVEVLAKELHVPTNEVARLYGIELAKLKIGARITGYLPIFAIRNVRIFLCHLKTKRPISA